MKFLKLVLFLCTSSCYAFFKLAGPFEIIIEGLSDCEDVGSGLVRHLFNVRKVNATTRLLQGRGDFKIPFDEKMSYDVKVAQWGSGGWGKNAYKIDGEDFCSIFSAAVNEVFVEYYNALGVPPKCPIPAGVYEMKNGMPLSYTKLKKFPILTYGRFKSEIKLLKGKEVVGCIDIRHRVEEIAR